MEPAAPPAIHPLERWYTDYEAHFARGAETLQTVLMQFIDDWSATYEIRCDRQPMVRVKGLDRFVEKCRRKGVEAPESLLQTPYPINDVIGGRIVVRSLPDAMSCRRAVEDNFPLTVLSIDDKISTPTSTGYRAIHVDSEIQTVVRASAVTLPVELQIKTFAQDSWGYYTHEEAYSRTDINSDARFRSVRELQRIVADQLHSVDQLQTLIERLSGEATYNITEQPLTPDVSYANVLNLIHELYGDLLSPQDTQSIVDLARRLQVPTIEDLRKVVSIDDASEEAETIVGRWREQKGRRPSRPEFLISLVESRWPTIGDEADG